MNGKGKRIRERKLVCCDADREVVLFIRGLEL